MTNKERIEIIRRKAHTSITMKNAYEKLSCFAVREHNQKLVDKYIEWAFFYENEARAYNDCLGLFGAKPEETDDIAEYIINDESKEKLN